MTVLSTMMDLLFKSVRHYRGLKLVMINNDWIISKSYGNNTTGFRGRDNVELMMIMEHET